MVAGPAALAGDRNVVITAETNNSVIITGDGNTVHLHHSSEGALLEHEYRWNRPRPRSRDDHPLAPPRFERHVDRDAEIRDVVGEAGTPRVVNVYGPHGVGKTYLLVAALNHPDVEMRDGTIYLDARGRDGEDLLHAIFAELFDSPVPIRDLRVERHLSSRSALVALEDAQLASADAQRLVLGAPRCRLFVTSRERVLYDGVAVRLAGLPPEHVATIAEQELGRPLSGSERAAVEAVGGALRGHPLQLRQMFSRARERGLSLEALAPRAASAAERAAELSAPQREVARTLAVHGTAPLGLEHIEALAGGSARAAAQALEERHDARSYSPRYSLVGALAEAFEDLEPDIDRALEHFIGWAEREAAAGRRERVLEEAVALVELLRRAQRAGRHSEVVRLGIAIEWPLAWGNRWRAWGQVLDLVLESARASGSPWAEGWALHEIGTRRYGLGDAPGAVADLRRALALRESIGDDAGAAATRQNLRVAGRQPPLLQRLSHLSLAMLAIMAVLLIGAAGVSGSQLVGGGGLRLVPGVTGDDASGPALVVSVVGEGAVASGGRSIRCATRCRKELDAGRAVRLRAEPQLGWQFSRWRGACEGRGTCRLVVRDDTRVTAVFTKVGDPRLVSVDVVGTGTVVSYPAGLRCGADAECEATFRRSGAVQLTAAAARGHRFTGWSGACSGRARCAIAGPDAKVAVIARFVADPDAVSLSVRPRGDGFGRVVSRTSGIDCGDVCSAGFPRGTRVVLRAIALPGSSFPGWTDPACATATRETCTITLEQSLDVAARFDEGGPPGGEPPAAERDHVLRVVVRGGGAVSSTPDGIRCDPGCTASLPEGQVLLTASAREGYRFDRWLQACAGDDDTVCRLTLDRPLTVLALFVRDRETTTETTPAPPPPPKTYMLKTATTGTAAEHGSITPDCSTPCRYAPGETQVLTADWNAADFTFNGWTGPCAPGPASYRCTVTMNSDALVEARFDVGPD